jgi:vacuolar iron transporter family protein
VEFPWHAERGFGVRGEWTERRGQAMEARDRERVLRNWREERDSAELYAALSAVERNARLSHVFSQLAADEREHALIWEQRLRAAGVPVPVYRPSARTRLVAALARRFGVNFVIPSITARELADRDRYSAQNDADSAGIAAAERGHAAVMRAVGTYGDLPEGSGDSAGGGVHAFANNLRASVLGANDGLASNFCLIMGVAGGGAGTTTILLTGAAGLVAGACSMALGEWLSVTSARELASSLVDRATQQTAHEPPADGSQLALFYEARGMSEDDARRLAERIVAGDPDALDRHARDTLDVDASSLGNNPTSAAAHSFVLFACGALVPVLPFFFLGANRAIAASIAASLVALFVVGTTTAFFTGRSAVFSGLRQIGIGALAAAVTFLAGRLFGAAIS